MTGALLECNLCDVFGDASKLQIVVEPIGEGT